MAQGNLIAGKPSSFTIGGTQLYGVENCSIALSSQNFTNQTDNVAEAMDGGKVQGNPGSMDLSLLHGNKSGDSVSAVGNLVEGNDPGILVATFDAEGFDTPQKMTATANDPRVESVNLSDSSGRQMYNASIQCFSDDGANKPIVLAYAAA